MLTNAEPAVAAPKMPMPKKGRPVPPQPASIRVTLRNLFYRLFYPLYFATERVLGAWTIFLFMRPMALLDLSRRQPQFPAFARLREVAPKSFWRGVTARQHYRKMIFDWHEFMGLCLMYIRFGTPYWQKRITVRGEFPFDQPGWDQRPVIIAVMHTGAYAFIRSWLRSRGIGCSLYVGGLPPILDHPAFQEREAAADRAYGVAETMGYFRTQHSLRDLLKFLKPGRVLVMAIDGGLPSPDSDRQETGDFPIFVKQGVCRIGAQVGAMIYPASMRRIGLGRYEVHFGKQVPDELLAEKDPAAATQHVVTELWRDIRKNPDELMWSSLESFPPTEEERQRVVDERPRTWP